MNNNGKKLLDKMSEVDPKLIEGAEKKPFKKRNLFIGLTSGMATVAAAAVIAVAATHTPVQNPPVIDASGSNSTSSTSSTTSTSSGSDSSVIDLTPKDPPVLDFSKYKDLPKITEIGDYTTGGAMGGGKEQFLNYSELEEMKSLWNGEEFETMPVYMSHSTDVDLDVKRMYAMARETAEVLGISAESLEITDNYPDLSFQDYHRKLMEDAGVSEEEIQSELDRMTRTVVGMTHVEAVNDSVKISIDSAFNIFILFYEPIPLPNEYNFTSDATVEEKAAVLDYLTDKYKALIPFENLTYKLGSFSAYKAGGELAEQMANHTINYVDFDESTKQDGALGHIKICSDANCDYLGDYPVLTAAQAKEILKSNRYDDQHRMPADAEILKVDLVYSSNGEGSTAVMPYYKFYVKTDKEVFFDKEVTCDVYTIAAVPEEFIEIETGDYGVYA